MKILLTTILILTMHLTQAQDDRKLNFTGGIYWNTFSMSDLKTLQNNFNSFFSGSETTNTFPSYLAFDLMIRKPVGKAGEVGIWSAYQSTGARNDYNDFTGRFRADFLIHSYVFGAAYRKPVFIEKLFLEGRL
ncbi:MAG: hypothetical protein AAFO69_14815, partial [Bacteroidota bacterium]